MTIKDLIIQELDQLPEPALEKLLEIVHSLKVENSENPVRQEVWEAYLASKQEREEVYRRLANS
jgi:hypothetical protein